MNWWLRTHLALFCAATLVGTMLLAPLLAGSALPIPSLFSGVGNGIPIPLVIPVIPAAIVLHAVNQVPEAYNTVAVRPVQRYRACMIITACIAAAVLAGAENYLIDFPIAFAVARNLAGYLGVGLIVQHLFGPRYGPLSVATVPVFCALVGLGPTGRPFAWTWPVHEAASALAGATAVCLFGIGLAANLLGARASRRARRR
ncbi:hypothetical protein [Streptomyces sp. NPDC000229]|uniref:hypothetical protein n=1 Tax=Streptomyces sp. NPDC000229 TaxID=3154247 RepID=UPI003333C4AD